MYIKINNSLTPQVILSFIFICSLMQTANADNSGFTDGHIKTFFLLNSYPDDSLFTDFVNSPSSDKNGDFRFKFNWRSKSLSLVTDYQIVTQDGDSRALINSLPTAQFFTRTTPDDYNRLFDLTQTTTENRNTAIVHRLDRLYINFNTDSLVTRIGRQVISWGNGLIYTPMDFFNPFDPSAIDKEYKTGDDMLYSQYLFKNGNDLQAVWVVRRDSNARVNNKVASIAAKYHGFLNEMEFDLLVAEHFGNNILGFGGIVDIQGAILRGDLTLTDTNTRRVTSFVTSLLYSWNSLGYNFSGLIEYFYNGFGQNNGDYSPIALNKNPQLTERLNRGELFTLGRHYLAVSSVIEISPLWQLTPSVFINISDNSYLTQLLSTIDLKQDWQLLAALTVPSGKISTEYGGIDSGIINKPLSMKLNLFIQLAWYF